MSDSVRGTDDVGNGKPAICLEVSAKDRDVERGECTVRGGNPAVTSSPSSLTSTLATEALAGASRGDGCGSVGRWNAVVRLLRRLAVLMLALVALAGALTAVWLFLGPLSLVQLFLVALVAYVVAGGRFRWFYVALKTFPRDYKAISRYVFLLRMIRQHERKHRSVADVFRQHVDRHPNKVCLVFEDQEWTFQQVEDFSNKIAYVFRRFEKGEVVALFLENRPEYVGIWLGLSKLGVITPLINTNLRKSTLVHSIKVANCKALIFGSDLSDAVKDISESLDPGVALYRFGEQPGVDTGRVEQDLSLLLTQAPTTPPVIPNKGSYSDKLLYIYTSGTTGLPKAAVITNSRFMFIASGIHFLAGFRSSDRFYTPLPLYHTAGGVMSIGQALLHGGTTVIRKKFSASAYFNDCVKYKCTVAQYIGEMCRYILAVPSKPEDTQHQVRVIFGNGLRPQIWKEFVKRFKIPQVAEFYGATEGNANIVNVDSTVGAIGFVSRIIPSVYPISIIKVDSDGVPIRNSKGLCQICEPNEPGVFIGKIIPNNPSRAFLGYVNQEASKSKVVHDVFTKGDSAFISGDILVADELGYLFFKDRTGDTFRWKGENVSTSEVEAVVSNLVNYRDCVVYGVEISGTEGKAGMAAIYDPNGTLDISKLAPQIKDQLPTYARPLFVRTLTKIDLTGTFKLKKKDLQEEGYDPRKLQDKIYYLDPKTGYQLLTPEIYDQIQQHKIRF
ncbi:long-chain fatty acid transport protein 4 [Orussus abietinus]|uniref:long-chain fatty acid transport protein 4 n=1 Tax=Orussus abietinus TaxID=222816 RepID=UPI000625A165|nr:long-chain fatty acid transport protein 4 [Orussus abietinus]XP_012283183.1 long-chain fatty acid transport protein 4 [Orussus abietinus]